MLHMHFLKLCVTKKNNTPLASFSVIAILQSNLQWLHNTYSFVHEFLLRACYSLGLGKQGTGDTSLNKTKNQDLQAWHLSKGRPSKTKWIKMCPSIGTLFWMCQGVFSEKRLLWPELCVPLPQPSRFLCWSPNFQLLLLLLIICNKLLLLIIW